MQKMWIIMKWLVTGILLFVLAGEDVRFRKVSVCWIVILGLVGIVEVLFSRQENLFNVWTFFPGIQSEIPMTVLDSFLNILFGTIPGLLLLGAGFFFTKQVGTGDGLGLVALGTVCGLQHTFAIFFYSSLCVGIAATVLLISGKGKRDTSLPHLLFVFVGYILFLAEHMFVAPLGG